VTTTWSSERFKKQILLLFIIYLRGFAKAHNVILMPAFPDSHSETIDFAK
jgi:hypothetical protein